MNTHPFRQLSALLLMVSLLGRPGLAVEEETDTPGPNFSTAAEGLSFTIFLDRQTYKAGEEISIKGKIENLTRYYRSGGGLADTPRFKITRNGTLIEGGDTDFWPGLRMGGGVLLHPGKSRVFTWRLTATFFEEELKKPGKYTIHASWTLTSPEVHWNAEKSLISNVVEFEILPPEGESGRDERPNGEHDTVDNARNGERADSQSDDAGGAEETSLAWLLYLLIGLAALAILAFAIYLLAARRRK